MTDTIKLALALMDEMILRKTAQLENERLRAELEELRSKQNAVVMEKTDG